MIVITRVDIIIYDGFKVTLSLYVHKKQWRCKNKSGASLNVIHNPVNNNYEQRENIFQDFLEIMHKSIYHGIHAIVFEGFYNNFCSGTDTCFLATAPTVYVIKIFIHIKIFYLYFSIRIILICLIKDESRFIPSHSWNKMIWRRENSVTLYSHVVVTTH